MNIRSIAGRVRHGISVRIAVRRLDSVLKREKQPLIFLFGAPFHSNMGDQAQTYCSQIWFERNYPGYKVMVFDTAFLSALNFSALSNVRRHIKGGDKIFLHSGYHTTDLYMLEENMQIKVVQLFPDFPLTILPQTIYFQTQEEKRRAEDVFNAHPNLALLCRDDVSYHTAQQLFPQCRLLLFPDIVTTMIGTKEYTSDRRGILFCMRDDKEAFYSHEQIEMLKQRMERFGSVSWTDTTIPVDTQFICKNRKAMLEQIWDEYSHYRAIVTDRYHGTIFSLIAGTPVFVLSSTDHKLRSGVKWFPPVFADYVQYVEDIDKLPGLVEEKLQQPLTHLLPAYFNEEYYNHLAEKLEETDGAL